MSDSVQPRRRRGCTRLRCPWDSPGKNTRVGCHFFLQCMKVKSQSEVVQSCPTLSDPIDCSLPGSSAHGIFQADDTNIIYILGQIILYYGFPGGTVVKNLPANAGDTGDRQESWVVSICFLHLVPESKQACAHSSQMECRFLTVLLFPPTGFQTNSRVLSSLW